MLPATIPSTELSTALSSSGKELVPVFIVLVERPFGIFKKLFYISLGALGMGVVAMKVTADQKDHIDRLQSEIDRLHSYTTKRDSQRG